MPTRKVTVGAFTGGIMTIVVWALKQWGHIDVPAEVAVAGTALLTFGMQYIVADPEQ